MARSPSTTARARRLRRELKRFRNDAGLSTDVAGERVGLSGPTVSRIEGGKRAVTVDETERFLDVYRVPLPQQREILDLADRAGELGWWQAYAGKISEDAQATIALEEEASRITNFELVLIPGLLQTAEYARDIIQTSNFGEKPRDIEAKVAARIARQSILTRPEAPDLHVLLDEAALRRQRDPQLMSRQLRHLVDSATRPNITVQIIPFTAGHHSSVEGPCLLFEFGDDPVIVHIEGKISGWFLEEADEVATYQEAIRRLRGVSLSPEESIEVIDTVSKELS